MALNEDLTIFFQDFGVSCTAGAVTALGILDMPGQVLAGGMVLSTDYTLTCKAADFGGLLYGDGITVDGVSYQVRETRKLDDGAFVEIGLLKLDPDVPAIGSNPQDIQIRDKKYAITVGDGSTKVFTVYHNLGTQDVSVTVFALATGEEVFTSIAHSTTQTVTLVFDPAPGVNAYRITVLG